MRPALPPIIRLAMTSRTPLISDTVQHDAWITPGGVVAQLTSRTLRICLPLGKQAAFEWRRPVCVTWQKTATQASTTVPIYDVTRLMQLAIWSGTLLATFLGYVIQRRRAARAK